MNSEKKEHPRKALLECPLVQERDRQLHFLDLHRLRSFATLLNFKDYRCTIVQ